MGFLKDDFCSVGTVSLIVNTGAEPTLAIGTFDQHRHHDEPVYFPPKPVEVEIKGPVKVDVKDDLKVDVDLKEPVKVDVKGPVKVDLKDEPIKIKGVIKEEEEFICFTLTTALTAFGITFPVGSRFAVNVDYIIAVGPVV